MTASSPLGFFEKNLTFWVLICIGLGTLLGNFFPDFFSLISTIEFGGINLIIVFLVWGMIYPMMVQIDFRSIKNFKQYPKGLALTIISNFKI